MIDNRKDAEHKLSWIQKNIQYTLRAIRERPVDTISLESYRASFDAISAITTCQNNVTIEQLTVNNLLAEWVSPLNPIPKRVILYFHSGTYINGSLLTDRSLVSMLASVTKTKVLQVAYRVAPESPFPTAVYDGLAAYQWLVDHGHAPHHIGLVGSASGGGIVLSTLLLMRDQGIPFPVIAACISPWVDLTAESLNEKANAAKDIVLSAALLRYAAGYYVRPEEALLPLASPLYADLHGLPPLFFLVGEHEILRQDVQRLAERVKACRGRAQYVYWGSMFHGWTAFAPDLPPGRLALEQIAAYFEKYFALIEGTWPDDSVSYRYKPYCTP